MSPKPCFPTILAGLQDSGEGGPPSSPHGRIQGDLACILQVEDQKVNVWIKNQKHCDQYNRSDDQHQHEHQDQDDHDPRPVKRLRGN